MPTPKPPKKDVFISYARRDGRDTAAWLRTEIEKLGLSVWQDVIDLPPGENWWQQIREAIEGVHTMVLVLTEGAMQSNIIKREWAHARKMGTAIIPVTRALDFYDRAPRWLSEMNGFILNPAYPDYAEHNKKFIESLRHPQPPKPVPLMAPPLPLEFTPRAEYQARLLDRLLNADHTEPRETVVTLVGQPGIGKSTLEMAVAYEQAVVEAYTGGILYLEVGESAAQIDANPLIEALGSAPVDSPDKAPQRLRELLERRTALIIFDDVWDEALIRPYLGIPGQSYLITTRIPAVAALDSTGEPVKVTEMTNDEGAALLLAYVPEPKRAPDALDRLRPLAARLGEWPLLLSQAGRDLRTELAQGAGLDGAIAWVMKGLDEAGLGAGSDFDEALEASMRSSLRRFSEDEAQRLRELAVFRDDIDVPEAAALRLWAGTAQVREREGGRLLRRLAGQFFLRDAEGGAPVIRFHDALRAYLLNQLGAEGARAAHAALLRAYADGVADPDWARIARGDAYLRGQLVYHLRGAGQTGVLQALFATPAWRDARFAGDGYLYSGYAADVMAAWDEAEAELGRQTAAGEAPHAFAQCARLALIRTSINSRAANYEPELVARAVELSVWTAARGLSVAAHVPDPEPRARLYTLLLAAGRLSEDERQAAVKAALAAARAISWESARADALAALASHLPDDLLADALAAARAIRDEVDRARALAALAPYLSDDQRQAALADALAAARAIEDEYGRARALAALAPHLSDDQRQAARADALAAARAIRDGDYRARALAALAPHLPADQRQAALADALAAARADAPAAPHLPAELLPDALAAARAIRDGDDRARALAALAPHLPADQRQAALADALAAARAIDGEYGRADALAALAPHLPAELRQAALADALAAARAIRDEAYRARALAALAPHLPAELRQAALADALAAARADAPAAPHLPAELLPDALAAARAIRDEAYRARALADLALRLPADQRQAALAEVHTAVAAHLRRLAVDERERVLQFLADERIFAPPVFPAETLAAIARHIVDVCGWAWE